LLGLAEMESVDRFITALTADDALDGIRLLDELERDGRDLVAFADQVVARVRELLIGALAEGNRAADRSQRLTRVARRLAGLDINRGAAGGYRLQLELALLEGTDMATDQPMEPTQPMAPTQPARPKPPDPAKSAPAPQAVRVEPPAPVSSVPAQVSSVPAQVSSVPAQVSSAALPGSPPPTPDRPPSADDPLQALLAAWPKVVERIGRNPANRPLIAACRPVEVSDATIVLGFPESQAFLRDIADRKRSMLEEGITEVLGRAVVVRCVATNVELVEPAAGAPAEGGSDDLVAQARRIFEGDLVDVAEVD
jgi:DNA polymerase III gamma/tau subunit